jgi:uncharacterized protein (TIGR02444 family)
VSEDHSPFWTFSLDIYADAAVQQECLDLQDRHGIDVNLLLFCAFVGAVHGAAMTDDDMRQAAGLVATWHKDVVGNLRDARRALKPFAAEQSALASAAAELRDEAKAAELEAERIEQAMLEAWRALRGEAWARMEPAAAIAANIRALFAIAYGPGEADLPPHLMAAALTAASRSRA